MPPTTKKKKSSSSKKKKVPSIRRSTRLPIETSPSSYLNDQTSPVNWLIATNQGYGYGPSTFYSMYPTTSSTSSSSSTLPSSSSLTSTSAPSLKPKLLPPAQKPLLSSTSLLSVVSRPAPSSTPLFPAAKPPLSATSSVTVNVGPPQLLQKEREIKIKEPFDAKSDSSNDYEYVDANSIILYKWNVTNIGTQTWMPDNIALVRVTGKLFPEKASPETPNTVFNVISREVKPNQSVNITVLLKVPDNNTNENKLELSTYFLTNDGLVFGHGLGAGVYVRPSTTQPKQTVIASVAQAKLNYNAKVEGGNEVITQAMPGEIFNKRWIVINNGTVPWPQGVTLAYLGGGNNIFPQPPFIIPQANVDETVTISINFKISESSTIGTSIATYRLMGNGNEMFGEELIARIQIVPPPPKQPQQTAVANISLSPSAVSSQMDVKHAVTASTSSMSASTTSSSSPLVTENKAMTEQPFIMTANHFPASYIPQKCIKDSSGEFEYIVLEPRSNKNLEMKCYKKVDFYDITVCVATVIFTKFPSRFTIKAEFSKKGNDGSYKSLMVGFLPVSPASESPIEAQFKWSFSSPSDFFNPGEYLINLTHNDFLIQLEFNVKPSLSVGSMTSSSAGHHQHKPRYFPTREYPYSYF